MARRRRTAEEAQTEILDAAERLLATEGPSALRIARVAKEVGISHPAVLHHFGTADSLVAALHQRVSGRIREDLLGLIDGKDRQQSIAAALDALADPAKGRVLAWVVASGGDPFPPAKERGLYEVARRLSGGPPTEDARFAVLAAVLSAMGESMIGPAVRERLGLSEDDAPRFRRWLLGRIR